MAKRLMDLTVATVLLVVLAVPLAVLYLMTRVVMGKPALYRSVRPGLDGRLFSMYKFRTMTDEVGEDGELLSDEERVTGFGRVIRSLSLDELPELINVVRGDMSLVGPRPLLPEYLSRYTPEQARRHEVRPGLTGLAQVSGRNELDWEDRLALDVWYVDNRSWLLDLQILGRTVTRVITRSGISAADHATMPEFRGSEDR